MAVAWQPHYLATTYCNGPLTWQPGLVKNIFVVALSYSDWLPVVHSIIT